MAKAREAAERAESSLARMAARYGQIDLEEYKRLQAQAAQLKVGWRGRAGARGGGVVGGVVGSKVCTVGLGGAAPWIHP